MDMKKLEFLDIYPDPISGSEKGYISISYIQHLDIYPGYISNGYISYPFLSAPKRQVITEKRNEGCMMELLRRALHCSRFQFSDPEAVIQNRAIFEFPKKEN